MTDIPRIVLLQYLKSILDEKSLKLIYCTIYGSHVYGTSGPHSDWDIFCVVDDDNNSKVPISLDIHNTDSKIDLTIRSIDLFEKDIKSGQPISIEVLLIPKKFILFNDNRIDQLCNGINMQSSEMKKTIRCGFSEKASWSEVRARKKMKDGKISCALKSLYHSYRILGFGIQIGLHGTIIDWSQGNEYLKELLSIDPKMLDDQSMRTSYKKWAKTGCSECDKDSIQTQFKKLLPL